MMNQMMNPDLNASREAMLREVDQAGFAVVDANLYLDTHPCDAAAIDYYNQMADAYRNAAAAFEAQFGPLTASANRDAAYLSLIHICLSSATVPGILPGLCMSRVPAAAPRPGWRTCQDVRMIC